MSFFDEGDEPTRVNQPRQRRPSPAARAGGRGSGGGDDAQALMVRRGVALGILVLVLILLTLGVRGCLASAKENALKDFNRDVAALMAESDQSVGKPFFDLMARGAREGGDLQVQINQLRITAEEQAAQARRLDVPGEMAPVHDDLEMALNLRAGALRQIADEVPAALGRGAASEDAIGRIAGQMRAFDASDVVFQLRVVPGIRQALDDAGVGGQRISSTQFLPDIAWLQPGTVADALGGSLSDSAGGSGEPAPGLHGHGLTGVSIAGQTLQPGQTNRVPAGSDLAFRVQFANQGDNDEQDVRVSVKISGSGKPITLNRTVDRTAKKTDAEVSIPLDRAPPVGQAVTVEATVRPVPGEGKTDNNSQKYTVIFTR